ncbi:MAG: hypothetical protein ACOCYR_08380, partial [Erythrobacter sp.]
GERLGLSAGLARFLEAPRFGERTDDDLSLIIASRRNGVAPPTLEQAPVDAVEAAATTDAPPDAASAANSAPDGADTTEEAREDPSCPGETVSADGPPPPASDVTIEPAMADGDRQPRDP